MSQRPRPTQLGPVRIAIRQDDDAGRVDAFIRTEDGEQSVLVSSINLALCQSLPAVFEAWKEAIHKILGVVTGACGHEVIRVIENRTEESN